MLVLVYAQCGRVAFGLVWSDPCSVDSSLCEPQCDDGSRDSNGSDLSCGGRCQAKCGNGQGCAVNEDCVSDRCVDNQCVAAVTPQCDDGVHNGDESDVDCGGSCGATCADSQDCTVNGDCVSNVCVANTCEPSAPRCDDGVHNGDESDVDCGGSCGATCADSQDCTVNGDCISDVCVTNTCEQPPMDYMAFGSGTAVDPYLLYTAEQIVSLGNTQAGWDKHYLQMRDIDMVGYDEGSMSSLGTQATPFVGVYDGGGYTVANFTYTAPSTDYVGFFGHVRGAVAQIRNVRLVDADVSGYLRTGGVVGLMHFSSIINSSVTGVVNGERHVGGLVGACDYGCTISSSFSEAIVVGNDTRIGGLLGSSSRFSRVLNSYATGNVSGVSGLGGLVGWAGFGQVTIGSYATGSVTGTAAIVGGFIGNAVTEVTITDCFATGDVVCDDTGSSCGSLIGVAHVTAVATNVYFNSSALCDNQNPSSCNVIGTGVNLSVTPDHFYTASNEPLQSMDFTNVWSASVGDYPTLAPNFLDEVAWGDCTNHTADAPFAGGAGSYENPYRICTATQLQAIGSSSDRLEANYVLAADIDLSAYTGTSFALIGSSATPFMGTFRGEGHLLSRFTYSDAATDDIGVFGAADHALFSRVGLPNANVVGLDNVGALLGDGPHSQVVASFSTGTVNGDDNVGGLVGARAYVYNSYSLSTVAGDQRVGSLIGTTTSITDSFAVGAVAGTGPNVGPVVGNESGSSFNCYYNTSGTCSGCNTWANTGVDLSGAEAGWFYNVNNPPFSGTWDFANTWQANAGDYPSLRR